jgi:hypothetical protein
MFFTIGLLGGGLLETGLIEIGLLKAETLSNFLGLVFFRLGFPKVWGKLKNLIISE